MTNKEAVWELMWDYRRDTRRSKTSYKRVLKALDALSIISADREYLLNRMGYHDSNGDLYSYFKDTK